MSLEIDTKRWSQNVLASTMLMKDQHPSDRVDGLYIHGLSAGMVESSGIFDQAVPYSRGFNVPIAFNGSNGEQFSHNIDGDDNRPVGKNPGEGWPGKNWYIEELTGKGIRQEMLLSTGPGYHTRN